MIFYLEGLTSGTLISDVLQRYMSCRRYSNHENHSVHNRLSQKKEKPKNSDYAIKFENIFQEKNEHLLSFSTCRGYIIRNI